MPSQEFSVEIVCVNST